MSWDRIFPWLDDRGEQPWAAGHRWPPVGGFVQDAWRPIPNLTVKAGLRYDSISYDMDRTGASVTMDRWQPRLGHRLGHRWRCPQRHPRLGRPLYGSGHHEPAVFRGRSEVHRVLLGFVLVLGPGQFGFRSRPCAPRRSTSSTASHGARIPRTGIPTVGSSPDARIGDNVVDPNLESAYSDQFILSYERALWPRSSVEFSLVTNGPGPFRGHL